MTLPAIPLAPGTRATAVVTRHLYLNRYVGRASSRQAERQAIGASDVSVSLSLASGSPRTTSGTLDADGHVDVATNLRITLIGATWNIVDVDVPIDTTDRDMYERLELLGYLPIAYAGAAGVPTMRGADRFIHERMVYDFQADHGIVATGELDDTTRDRIVEVLGE